jgi:Sulfotransferase domain
LSGQICELGHGTAQTVRVKFLAINYSSRPANIAHKPEKVNVVSGLFSKKEPARPVVVVSGLPRSGTSMLMGMLNAGGIPLLTDNLRAADDDNPHGYYEFEPVKKLRQADFSWLPLAQGKAVKIISWLITYLPPTQTYQILFMQRALVEILASQRKMLIHRGEDPDKASDEEMAQYFEKHLTQVSAWLKDQQHISTLYVDYNQIQKDPTNYAQRINIFLGGKLNVEAMIDVVDPLLYRQRLVSSQS